MYLISICIPTYNGANALKQTIESILQDMDPSMVEVVIHDDYSTDRTLEIAYQYAREYDNISVYVNEQNTGMDRNFTKSALMASGKYVWFCGQDDIFQPGAVSKIIAILENDEAIDMIYLNHKYVTEDLKTVLSQKLHLSRDRVFEGSQEFFEKIDFTPTFLPSIIMRQDFWRRTDFEIYFNTYYVQSGVWLENAKHGRIYVVADPSMILGKMPRDSWKYTGGHMIFGTALGFFKVHKIAYLRQKISFEIYGRMKKTYLKGYLPTIIAGKAKGLSINKRHKDDLAFLLQSNKFVYFAYILPLLYLPIWLAKAIYWVRRTSKRFFHENDAGILHHKGI